MMYINRRRLKKKKKNKVYRITWLVGVEAGLCILFLLALLFVFHRETKKLLSPLVYAKNSFATIMGMSDARPMVEKLLQDNRIAYTDIRSASQSAYIILLAPDETAVVSSERDLASQIASLQVILNRLTMEGKRFTRLDLRFEKPVIVAK